MAAKSLANRNRKYIVTTRELSSVCAELDKTSATQPNDYVNVKASSSSNVSRVVIALIVAVVITIVVSVVVVVVVILNKKGDEGETTTVPPVNEPQVTGPLSTGPTDVTPASTQTTGITSTESGKVLWSTWGEWTQCTATCNSGIHKRYRRCIAEDSSACLGDIIEAEICLETTCQVFGKWTSWGSWEGCDVTCGGGAQFRSRQCVKTDYSDLDCVGNDQQDRTCSDWKCPDCNTKCAVGNLNIDCDTCVCKGNVTTGRVLAKSTGYPISNAALYASTAPTKLLTTSNSTGFFTLDATCSTTELIVIREGFVDTVTAANNSFLEISMSKLVLPYLTETPQSKCRLAGENVTMCCEAVADPSVDYFEWIKDGILLEQNLFKNGNNMTLSDLTATNSGVYQCRANSRAGAIISPAVTLTVKEKSGDFCADALQPKTIVLPDDCVQNASNATYEVGECTSKKCREEATADFGSCRDDISSCCTIGEADLKTVQCSGYDFDILVVRSCRCAACKVGSLIISGTALALDGSPLRYGQVWANGVFQGYTSSTGSFNFEASRRSSKITINLKDIFFKHFLQAVKVIEISDDVSGLLHVNIRMIRVVVPVEIDSNIANTIEAGTLVNNDTAPIVQISIPANAFYFSNGTQYNGIVEASLTVLDPMNTSIFADIPGVFKFVNEEGQMGNLASLAVFNLYFADTSGQLLVLDEVVDLYLPEELGDDITNKDIKLWKMNSDTGVWEYVTSGPGIRRRKRETSANWVGEIDFSTVTSEEWYNYDRVYDLTDNSCYFKVRLFKDKSLTEPVPDPERTIEVNYHILDKNALVSIYHELNNPEDQCVIGICEGDNAFISVLYFGLNGYEALYAGAPKIGSSYSYTITDEDKVLKIQMKSSSDGPFFENETQCMVSNSDNSHMRYHYGKTYEGFIPIETFHDRPGMGIEQIIIGRKAWYHEIEGKTRACFIKVRLLFEEGVYLTPGQYIKLKATSYGGTNTYIYNTFLGVKENVTESLNGSSTYCIEYKCSGYIDVDMIDYTRVVLNITYPSSDIKCEVTGEADFITDDPTSLNVAQLGNTNGSYVIYAPLVYAPKVGIYSETDTQIPRAIDQAEKLCRSGKPKNYYDDNADTGVAVTFTFKKQTYCNYRWSYWC